MNMIEVKTSELIGPALDWAVAKAIEWKEPIFCVGRIRYIEEDQYLIMDKPDPDEPDEVMKPHHFNHYEQWSPSRIWSQGGPLIEKYSIAFRVRAYEVDATIDAYSVFYVASAKTHLIASCRPIVAAKLGDTVSIPAELWRAEQ